MLVETEKVRTNVGCVVKLVNTEEVGAQPCGDLGSQGGTDLQSLHPEGKGAGGVYPPALGGHGGLLPGALIPSTSVLPQQTPERPAGPGAGADTWHLGQRRKMIRADGTWRALIAPALHAAQILHFIQKWV